METYKSDTELFTEFWSLLRDAISIKQEFDRTPSTTGDSDLQAEFDFVYPRISRTRTRTRSVTPPVVLNTKARDGITYEITVDRDIVFYDAVANLESIKDSFINKEHYKVFADSPPDNGGEMTLLRSIVNHQPASFSSDWVRNTKDTGQVPVTLHHSDNDGFAIWDFEQFPSLNESELAFLGTKAWTLSKPAQPYFSFYEFVTGLRDLPNLIKFRLDNISSLGDAYLNLKFGWENLLSDIRSLWKSYMKVADYVEFLVRNNGQSIRRRFKFPMETSFTVISDDVGVNGLRYNSAPMARLPSIYDTSGYHRLVKEEKKSTWFSGNFIFYINSKDVRFFDTPESRSEILGRIMGLNLTPSSVWQIIPWSWLSDYFVNIGDILSNISSEVVDRQLSTYAYLMQEVERRYTREGSDGYLHASCTRVVTSKVRRKVDPYGLATTDTLTLGQAFILAALGISRV